MRRRDLLAVGGTGAVVPGYGIAMNTPTATPIIALFREWQRLDDAAANHVTNLTGKAGDEELERLFYRERDAIEAEMMALPCQTPADFAAKVIVDTCKGELFSDWETGPLWIEARALAEDAA